MEDRQRPVGDAAVAATPGGTALRIDAALLGVLWVGSAVAWFSLPDRFPIHFDFAGNPDSWVARSAEGFVLWMLLPAIATLTSAFLRWAPRAARTNPALWNIPRKREFLALAAEAREPAQRIMEVAMARITALTSALLVLLQLLIWATAHGWRPHALVIVLTTIGYGAAAITLAVGASGRVAAAIPPARAGE